ncbi:hypothetical protein CN692_19360 [Bacillus sp. AFS002410]|uniref:DUF5063 domain-containing protein n=1 Tax=Bacillus sp. AFS002410 TaxID=2033481 RepID=UPI000BF00840|nr:DUF5063 domain-containing protein [Bacillus sp. AFS002410]PEJ54494.1 hypothetical protein CN692_19360 [Bacillus sp. AFS002410]
MKNKAVDNFFNSAIYYCNLVENFNSNQENDKLKNLVISLLDLYSKALLLPDVEPKNADSYEFDVFLPQINFEQYDWYWVLFNPYNLNNIEEPVFGSLSDDILDIYKDVKEGILLYDQNEQLEAIWHWKFHFQAHWGRHAVDAIRALHSINFN